jgi:hypothetical protein
LWVKFGRETGNTRFWIDPSLGDSYEGAYSLFLDDNTGEYLGLIVNHFNATP